MLLIILYEECLKWLNGCIFFCKVSDYADLITKVIYLPATITFLIIMLLQVIFCYALKALLTWYIEVIEIAFIWAIYMAIPIELKSNSHICFKFLLSKRSAKTKKVLKIFTLIISFFFFLFMLVYRIKYFIFSRRSFFTVLNISIKWKYLCIPISGFVFLIHNIDALIEELIEPKSMFKEANLKTNV